ncbi:MAG: hypothetical protein VB070_11620 [Clostridiaceae bacterium]|nr:hypothetical protein [Clostridiaceae bacterium]
MMELPTELKQRLAEAGKDGEWAEKVRNAGSWETYAKLLGEKGIELPAEVKNAFDADRLNKTGQLEDNDLEKVTGGWTNVFNCPRAYHLALCEWTFCPHIKNRFDTPDEDHYDLYCDLGYWTENRIYPQRY